MFVCWRVHASEISPSTHCCWSTYPPDHVPPPRNDGFFSGKRMVNKPFISGYVGMLEGGRSRLTSHGAMRHKAGIHLFALLGACQAPAVGFLSLPQLWRLFRTKVPIRRVRNVPNEYRSKTKKQKWVKLPDIWPTNKVLISGQLTSDLKKIPLMLINLNIWYIEMYSLGKGEI